MRAKLFAKAILLASLPVLSIFAYPQLLKNVGVNVAANVGHPDVEIAVSEFPSTLPRVTQSRDLYSETFRGSGYVAYEPPDGCARARTVTESGSENPIERTPDYRIMLKSRKFAPKTGVSQELRTITGVEKNHVIIQFMDIPRADEIQTLRTHGVELLDYLPHYAYFASVPVEEFDYLASHPNVRSVISVQLDDKISPHIRDYGVGSWARNEDGTVRFMVILFDDIARESAIDVLETYGKVNDAPEKSNIFMISIPESSILTLAEEDAVQWIEVAPPEKETNLDQARGVIGADIVQASPYNLDGTGVTVAEWDGGWIHTAHNDFLGRVVIGDAGCIEPNCGFDDHPTHVGGIMAGDGTLSGGVQRGIAPNADIRSYEWPNTIAELDTETSDAITNNATLSQNSWSYRVRAIDGNCYLHGDYDSMSQRYDEIVNGDLGDEIVLVGSAANEENDGDCPPYPWNQTNPPICTAKNSICVGAIYSDTLQHTCFSSRGPTDDGRLKPDMVAPGDEALDDPIACLENKMINSTVPDLYIDNYLRDCDGWGDDWCYPYDEMGGTSMSAPMVSGAIALLRQQFDNLGYGEIKPHTFKAILVQTADDLGNPGPDYTYGHGNLDIKEAVDLTIENYPNNELIRTGTVVDDEIDYYNMSVPSGVSMLRVTLAWDDIEGTPGAAKELVNDLDLFLISPSNTLYQAYRLDPSNPGNNAYTGWNDLDNVEVVEVDDPEPGKWSVGVWGWVVTGTEQYTVIAPYEDINCGDYIYHNTTLGYDLNCVGDGLKIGSSDLTLDCNGHTLQGSGTGYGIENTRNFVTIENCTIIDFDYGIYMHDIADYNHLLNNNVLSNDVHGIHLNDAWSNEIRDNDVNLNAISGGNGLFLFISKYNDILHNSFEGNYGHAIDLYQSNDNNISYNDVRSSTSQGVDIRSSDYTTISFNNITENGNFGIYIYQSHYNDVLNNFVDNSSSWSVYLLGSNDTEFRNNIVNHPNAIGVVSSNSNSTVFSNNTVCGYSWDFHTFSSTYNADENTCDSAYQFVDSGQPDACDFKCSGCRRPEADTNIYKDTTLCPGTYNIPDTGSSGVLIVQSDSLTLDCNGTVLIGDDSGSGILVNGPDGVTINNCTIENYQYGLRLVESIGSQILDNEFTNNSHTGIFLSSSNSCVVDSNLAYSNLFGIYLYSASTDNHVQFNDAIENDYGIYVFGDRNYVHDNIVEKSTNVGVLFASAANNNELNNNIVCANSLDINDLDMNSGDNNYCNTTSNWNDIGTTGCTSVCLPPDVAVLGAGPARMRIPDPFFGTTIPVVAVVENQGMKTQTFDVSIFYDTTPIGTSTVTLVAGAMTVVSFSWNLGALPNGVYMISANASIVPGEIDVADNHFAKGEVRKTFDGEVNADGIVDAYDLLDLSKAYGSTTLSEDINSDGIVDYTDYGLWAIAMGTTPVDPDWNPYADLDPTDYIDLTDFVILIGAFGETGSPNWNPYADMNADNEIDASDLSYISNNYGKTV